MAMPLTKTAKNALAELAKGEALVIGRRPAAYRLLIDRGLASESGHKVSITEAGRFVLSQLQVGA